MAATRTEYPPARPSPAPRNRHARNPGLADASAAARLRLKRVAKLAREIPELTEATRAMITGCVEAHLMPDRGTADPGDSHPIGARVCAREKLPTVDPSGHAASSSERLARLETALAAIRGAFEAILRLTRAACKRRARRKDG